MVRQASPAKNSTLLGSAAGPLELRVTNAPLAGQIVQLHGSKCTIGSGRRCTLRLQARRVESVHCLIMRGENSTVIRRWSPNTRLNGAAFTDALLQPGDRLTIGPIVLEVVATGRALEESASTVTRLLETSAQLPTAEQAVSTESNAKEQAALQARLTELADREELLSMQEEELLEKQLAWEAEQKEKQEEIDDLRHQLGNAQQRELDLPVLTEEHERLKAELAEKQKQLDDQQVELRRAQDEFETKRLAQENALVQRRRELDEQADSLTLERERLSAEQEKHQAKQREAAEAFEAREAELNKLQLKLDQELKDSTGQGVALEEDLQLREEDLANAQSAWASERSMWEITFQQTSDELKQTEQELEAKRNQWEQEKEQTLANLSEQQEALEQLRQTLQSKQDRLDAQQTEWNQTYAKQSAELEEQKADFADQTQTWEEQRASMASQAETNEESEADAEADDTFEPIQAPESHADQKTEPSTDLESAFHTPEEEASEESAFEPLSSISDSLSYLTRENARENEEKKEHSLSVEEQAAEDHLGLDNYEVTDEPTELEASAEHNAPVSESHAQETDETESGTPESEEMQQDSEAAERSRSKAEELLGKLTGTVSEPADEVLPADEETAEQTEEEAEEDDFEPVSSTFLYREETPEEEEHQEELAAEQDTESEEELDFSEPTSSSPAENSGVMERLRAMTDWEEDEEESGQSEFRPATPFPAEPASKPMGHSRSSSSHSHTGDGEDEESIEDYMAKMMMRIRGVQGSATQASQAPPPAPVKKEKSSAEMKPSESAEQIEMEAKSKEPQKPFEMAPRKAPVELTSNLAAMRELANVSAREAIDLSVRNRWSQAAFGKLSVAGVALLAAGILFYWTRDPMTVSFLGGGVASLIAVFWALQGAVILKGVRKAKERYGMPLSEEEEQAQLRQRIYEDHADEPISTPETRETEPATSETAGLNDEQTTPTAPIADVIKQLKKPPESTEEF